MIRDFFLEMPIVAVLLTLFIAGIIFLVVDGVAAKTYTGFCQVIDKHYQGESSSTGIGTGVGSSGGITTVVVSEHDPEKFIIIIRKLQDDKIETIQASPDFYYKTEVGHNIVYVEKKGYFTKMVWSIKAVR